MTAVGAGTLPDHAAAYARAGLEIFPLQPDKTPYRHREHPGAPSQYGATTDVELVAQWWERWPQSIIGHRIAPNVLLIDIDPKHQGDRVWRALRAEYGDIPATRCHLSGRNDGGGHLWFDRPDRPLDIGPMVEWAKTRDLAIQVGPPNKLRWTAGIDLLHHGHRYTILPPSPHPDTGQPYRWRGDPEADIAPMPPWLERLVTKTAPDAGHTLEAMLAASPRSVSDGGDSIADWFTQNSTWHQLLGRHGWTVVSGDGERDGSEWRHPQATNTSSASIRHGLLFVHSDRTVFEPTAPGAPAGYTRFRAYAVLEHGGDGAAELSAAAYSARERKDGPMPASVDLESLIAPPANGAAPVVVPVEWGKPLALEKQLELPGFPLHVLPPWIVAQAEDVAHQLQVPVDLPALLAIGALATVISGKARIVVAEGWVEHLNLYIAVAMPPSSGKSPAAKAMLAPVERLERELIETHAQIVAEAEQRKRIAEKRAKKLEDTAARTGDPKDAIAAVTATLSAQATEVPPRPRLLCDDATPEALANLLAEHGGRITIASTEGGLFELMTGRYSDGKANLEIYLKGWSADFHRVDRIGRPPVHIPEAIVNVVLTVQPEVLRALADRPELAGKGVTARFLYAVPVDLVGYRDRRRPRPADASVRMIYADQLIAIGRTCSTWAVAGDIRLQEDAADLFGAWAQGIEERRKPEGDLRPMADWSGKLESAVLRLAGLLHIADGRSTSASIDASIIARALEVGDYWLAHARAVHELWGGDETNQDARAVLEWIARTRPETFTAPEVERGVNRIRGKRDRTEAAVERLAEYGWLRAVGGAQLVLGKRPGKAAQRLEPHPQVLTGANSREHETRARSVEVTLSDGIIT